MKLLLIEVQGANAEAFDVGYVNMRLNGTLPIQWTKAVHMKKKDILQWEKTLDERLHFCLIFIA